MDWLVFDNLNGEQKTALSEYWAAKEKMSNVTANVPQARTKSVRNENAAIQQVFMKLTDRSNNLINFFDSRQIFLILSGRVIRLQQ
jgi:hypothetical protein